MLDNVLRGTKDRLLIAIASRLYAIHPTTITGLALMVGLISALLLTQQQYLWGLACWLGNRILDGFDGTMARLNHQQSDLGGYLDIMGDFVVYAFIPLALVVGSPTPANYLSLGFLLGAFYINSASWMYLAAILEKRQQGAKINRELTSITMPPALIGGAETIIFYCLFILFPQYLTWLFGLMSVLVLVSVGQRLRWAVQSLDQ